MLSDLVDCVRELWRVGRQSIFSGSNIEGAAFTIRREGEVEGRSSGFPWLAEKDDLVPRLSTLGRSFKIEAVTGDSICTASFSLASLAFSPCVSQLHSPDV